MTESSVSGSPPRTAAGRLVPNAGAIALFVAGYVAAYLYSFSITFHGQIPAPFWAPDAVLLCALLLSPRRSWWFFLLLAIPIRFALTASSTLPAAVLLLDVANHLGKALVTAAILRRGKPTGAWFSSARDFAVYLAVAVVTVPALSALVGAAARRPDVSQFQSLWTGWFFGDALANLLLTPLILTLAASPPPRIRSWRRTAETCILLAGLLASGAIAFRGGSASFPAVAIQLCIPFPFLLWAAARYDVRGTSAALVLFAVVGIWAVAQAAPPTPGQLYASVLSLQLFLFVVGSSLLFLAVVLDERRAVEADLRSTQARLAQAEARSMVMVAQVGLDGRWLSVPRRLAELLGHSRRELLEKSSHDLTHPADLNVEFAEDRRLLADEIPSFQLEKRFVKPDGAPTWFYMSRSVMRDPDGQPVGYLDYLANIDERKNAEAAFRKSEHRLRVFAEHSPAAVAMLDADLRFVVASSRFRKDFQCEGAVLGVRYDEALPAFPQRWPEALRRALGGEVEVSEDDAFTRPDGTVETLRWDIRPGAPSALRGAGAFLFAELTTERRRSEHALEDLRRQLVHLTRVSTLGELSGALAHELNQPLAAILANAQAAQRFLARGQAGSKEVASILEDIVADDVRASEVIRSLRKLLRKGEPELHALDVNELIREVLDLAHGDLITRNVAVSRDLAAPLPSVLGDRVQLQQVLLNLIVNACEAMAGGDEADRRLRVATTLEGDNRVRVSVDDSGPGIPGEMRDRIFEPFLTTKERGLGLGLTISRSLVMSHGGRIWMADNEFGGASFHLTLPAGDAHVPEAPEEVSAGGSEQMKDGG